jgi:acyl-CoA thioester hydrolase
VFFGESRLLLQVRPNDLDVLGHVNNAVAIEYLEAGRWDWLDRHGLVRGERLIAVVARCEADYLAEIPHGRVEVRTVLESPNAEEFDEDGLTYRARFRQRIHLPDVERPAVDALITVAFLDAAQRRLMSLQDFLVASGPGRDRKEAQ